MDLGTAVFEDERPPSFALARCVTCDVCPSERTTSKSETHLARARLLRPPELFQAHPNLSRSGADTEHHFPITVSLTELRRPRTDVTSRSILRATLRHLHDIESSVDRRMGTGRSMVIYVKTRASFCDGLKKCNSGRGQNPRSQRALGSSTISTSRPKNFLRAAATGSGYTTT